MARTVAILGLVAVMASAAYAGALGYNYTMPGETTVWSQTLQGVTPVAQGNGNWGADGYWSLRDDTDGDGFTASGINTGLIRAGADNKGFTGAATYNFAPINLSDGPITLYWTAALNSGTAWDANGSCPTGIQVGYSSPGFVSDAGQSGEAQYARFGLRTENTGFSGLETHWMNSVSNAANDGAYGTVASGGAPMATDTRISGTVKFRATAMLTSDDTIMNQVQYLVTAGGNDYWVDVTPLTDHNAEAFLGSTTYPDTLGAVDSVMIVNNAYVQGIWNWGAGGWQGPADPADTGWMVTDMVLTQAASGNTNGDDYVNGDDYFNVVEGFGSTVTPAGNLVDTPDNPDLIYDATTGNLTLDLNDQTLDTYQIKAAFTGTSLMPIFESYSPGGLITETATELFESNATGSLLATLINGVYVFDLGDILPTGMDINALAAYLGEARWASGTSTSGDLDLIVVPEPATLALLGLGGLALLRRRRA